MQPHRKRQLFSRLVALAGFASVSLTNGWAGPDDELRATRLLEVAVFTDWKKNPTEENAKAATANLDRAYSELVAKYPRHAEIRNARASYLWSIDRNDEAAAEWETASMLDPRNAEVAYHLGGCRLAEGRIKEADECFARAVALEPENALYHYNLATALFLFRHQLGGADERKIIARALVEFRRAIELDPFNSQFANGYAETFYALPDADLNEALKAWMHVLKITPDDGGTYLHLARVSLRLGHKKDAEEFLAKIQSGDFNRAKANLRRQIEEAK